MKMSKPSPRNDSMTMELPLTLSAADSPARTLATQESAAALKASAADYGKSTPVLLANYDRDTSSWRTLQHCLVEGLGSFSGTWPRSGMMRSGIAYRLPSLARITSEIESGSLPTLTIHGNYNAVGSSKTSGDGIITSLKRIPTLCAREYRHGATPSRTLRMMSTSARGLALPSWLRLSTSLTGPINPCWAEGFMGYPIGWTECELLETRSSRKSPKSSDWQ